MSWQKCPVCNGSGVDLHCLASSSALPVCPTCKGGRIISELNGLPLPCYSEAPRIVRPAQWPQEPIPSQYEQEIKDQLKTPTQDVSNFSSEGS